MTEQLATLFLDAGCEGWLEVQPLKGGGGVALDPTTPVVAASVIKVLIGLEITTQIAEGALDPRERLVLRAVGRTPGPTGISLFDADVELALGDLVTAMLTISDNAATDALIHRVGVDAINDSARRLGLTGTVLVSDLHTMIEQIAVDAGYDDYAALVAGLDALSPGDELTRRARLIAESRGLTPLLTTRTTAADMVRLLRLIWSDGAGPATACASVRRAMGRQLTRHRLASGFADGVSVAAKSGGLMGLIRNEIGVITYPDGERYLAAVFTRSHDSWVGDATINRTIGYAASLAVSRLRAELGTT